MTTPQPDNELIERLQRAITNPAMNWGIDNYKVREDLSDAIAVLKAKDARIVQLEEFQKQRDAEVRHCYREIDAKAGRILRLESRVEEMQAALEEDPFGVDWENYLDE